MTMIVATLFCFVAVLIELAVLYLYRYQERVRQFRRLFNFEPPQYGRCGRMRRSYLEPLVQDTLSRYARPIAERAITKDLQFESYRECGIAYDQYQELDALFDAINDMNDRFENAYLAAEFFQFALKERREYFLSFQR